MEEWEIEFCMSYFRLNQCICTLLLFHFCACIATSRFHSLSLFNLKIIILSQLASAWQASGIISRNENLTSTYLRVGDKLYSGHHQVSSKALLASHISSIHPAHSRIIDVLERCCCFISHYLCYEQAHMLTSGASANIIAMAKLSSSSGWTYKYGICIFYSFLLNHFTMNSFPIQLRKQFPIVGKYLAVCNSSPMDINQFN